MADALVLGTSSNGVRVRPPSPAPTHLRTLPSGGSVLSRRRPKEGLMVYTIGEMAKMLGGPASTLRY